MADQSPRKYTRKEVEQEGKKTNALFVINNVVYDVTKFLDDHPGGHEVLLNLVGKDASEEFDDVGHSLDAKEMMVKYRLGDLVDEDRVEVAKRTTSWSDNKDTTEESFFNSWKFPVALGLIMTLLYSYLFG